jgi:hypothetical protein
LVAEPLLCMCQKIYKFRCLLVVKVVLLVLRFLDMLILLEQKLFFFIIFYNGNLVISKISILLKVIVRVCVFHRLKN